MNFSRTSTICGIVAVVFWFIPCVGHPVTFLSSILGIVAGLYSMKQQDEKKEHLYTLLRINGIALSIIALLMLFFL